MDKIRPTNFIKVIRENEQIDPHLRSQADINLMKKPKHMDHKMNTKKRKFYSANMKREADPRPSPFSGVGQKKNSVNQES